MERRDPGRSDHTQNLPPPQQIVRIRPHRQRADIGQNEIGQVRRDRFDLGVLDQDQVRHRRGWFHSSYNRDCGQLDSALTK